MEDGWEKKENEGRLGKWRMVKRMEEGCQYKEKEEDGGGTPIFFC